MMSAPTDAYCNGSYTKYTAIDSYRLPRCTARQTTLLSMAHATAAPIQATRKILSLSSVCRAGWPAGMITLLLNLCRDSRRRTSTFTVPDRVVRLTIVCSAPIIDAISLSRVPSSHHIRPRQAVIRLGGVDEQLIISALPVPNTRAPRPKPYLSYSSPAGSANMISAPTKNSVGCNAIFVLIVGRPIVSIIVPFTTN